MMQDASSQVPFARQVIESVDLSNPVSHDTLAVDCSVVKPDVSKSMVPFLIVYGGPQSIEV
jgi:hypothetical protein